MSASRPSDDDLVELTSCRTPFEAEWIVGALSSQGIRATTFGAMLADEFAVSQELIGSSGGIRVVVLRADLERAQAALTGIEGARRAATESGESHDGPPGPVERGQGGRR